MVLPLLNIYHIQKKFEKISICRPHIWSRNFHNLSAILAKNARFRLCQNSLSVCMSVSVCLSVGQYVGLSVVIYSWATCRFLLSIWLKVIYSFVYPSVVSFHRKVAVTLKLNNFWSIAQIAIKLYIFGILRAFGVQLIQTRWEILWWVTSRDRKPGVFEVVWKSSKSTPKWSIFRAFSNN